MSTPLPIDWGAIRPLRGTQNNAFEELCCQLARCEAPAGAKFTRNGTPDGGAECFAALADGTEWVWQAKYFFELGSSQISQIKESIERVLDTHPKVSRYTVCLPFDLPDARKKSEKSARERWEAAVGRWTAAAVERGLSVHFELWGSHELLELLAHPGHAGRVRFWWDVKLFDRDWLNLRFEEARAAAGPRYTPAVNVELPVASDLEDFGRTAASLGRLRGLAKDTNRIYPPTAELSRLGGPVAGKAEELTTAIRAATAAIRCIEYDPASPPRFEAATSELDRARRTAGELIALVAQARECALPAGFPDGTNLPPLGARGFDSVTFALYRVCERVTTTVDKLESARRTASASVAILTGPPGCGKTHLLCDIAEKRLAAGLPTILVMGQRMISTADPWAQVLEQLHLKTTSADEFIASLEACAQEANARALILVDAINEGTGRRLWAPNLAAFLARATRSPWVGIVIGVRSSYLGAIVPQHVREQAVTLKHHGFEGLEYAAAGRFFGHYAIELPSAPLLSPEYSNPLFLKSLCDGLRGNGCNRVPKGHHGIRWVFDLYVTAAAKKAADALLTDEQVPRKLLSKFAAATADGPRWMDLDKFQQLADQILPGQSHSESLATALISEGLFMKEFVPLPGSDNEVVMIAYDRLADYLQAEALLDGLDAIEVEAALRPGGRLEFICAGKFTWNAGLIEALCLAIPERTGKEFPALLPDQQRESVLRGGAFLQSLIWRSPKSITDETFTLMLQSQVGEHPADGVFEVLLTLATVTDHPLNAKRLHETLFGYDMPGRDAIWSTYLQRAYGEGGALDRLADWSPPASAGMDDDTAELFCITLTWLFTSPNRRLRDRATKSLVRALAQDPQIAERLYQLFEGVDDPYVLERLHAALYGVAMIADEPEQVTRLAACVYEAVFAGGSPPADILSRDYARGVIERSVVLGNPPPGEPAAWRPPYASAWPNIPDENEIKPLLPEWSKESGYDSGSLLWSRNIIGSSVMSGDFGRYVIGTNSGRCDWLKVPIAAPPWLCARDRIRQFLQTLGAAGIEDWNRFQSARSDALAARAAAITAEIVGEGPDDEPAGSAQPETEAAGPEESALERLCIRLGPVRAGQLRELLDEEGRQPPYFELKAIQRYILKRVFELGWSVERFGRFDRGAGARMDRSSHPTERIGKKYQWISLGEIRAYLSDHYQFVPWTASREAAAAYNGPWQALSMRDIDPSCTLDRVPGGTGYGPHHPSWWAQAQVDDWRGAESAVEWVSRPEVPDVPSLLLVSDRQGTKWANLAARYSWIRPSGRDLEFDGDERWEVWLHSDGFFVRQADAPLFEAWAKRLRWDGLLPGTEAACDVFLGEFYWSPAWRDNGEPASGWSKLRHGCPCAVISAALKYAHSANGYDHSSDDSYSLSLPAAEIVTGLGLKWSGFAADFLDSGGRLTTQDPTAHESGPTSLLIRLDALRAFLDRERLALFWIILGERRAYTGLSSRQVDVGETRIHGAYSLVDDGPAGATLTDYRSPHKGRDEGN